MQNNNIFELEIRKIIYKFLTNNPGLHFREIQRSINIPASTLNYHLKYLEKRNLLIKEFENGYSRYFISQKIGKNDKKLLNILRETVPRNIVLYLFLFSDSSKNDIIKFAKKWKKHPSKIGYHLNKHYTTLGFHLKKLINDDVLESFTVGKEIKYRIKDPEDIIDLLIKYDKSILAEAYGCFLKHLEKADNDEDIDGVMKLIFDIFPLPFCS